MKRTISSLIFVLLAGCLCGCSNGIAEGEVYKKEYREECTMVMTIPSVIPIGKTTTIIMIPYSVRYPERYVIFIKAYQDEEWKTEDYYVSKEVYDSINVGDMFLYDKERGDLQDEPYTKERKED